MVCDESKCLPPEALEFEIELPDYHGEVVSEEASTVTEEPETASEPENKSGISNKSFLEIFILAFLSGFAALLTPCVFPMIPMTVSFFTKQSKSKAQGIRNAIFYGLSIIVIYVILGTVVTAIFGSEALNELATNVWFNLIFFVLLVVFAISFLGAFEIVLPSSWINAADRGADKGGIIGIFFMAFTLALVSFSCTGPIVGTLIVEAAAKGGIMPIVGMLGFSLALALPFGLFAAFPGWLNSLPQSGGWLNSVKVVLGFLELGLAIKFLSNADLVLQAGYVTREIFIAFWIVIASMLGFYLLGKIRLPHDSPIEKLSVGRTLLAVVVFTFTIYLIPGMWGAPLKLIAGFPPPMHYAESPGGAFSGSSGGGHATFEEGMHLGPQGIPVFHELEKAKEYAKKVDKSVFVDFTGHACANCRKMEENVWGQPGILEPLKNDVVIVSLYVDDRAKLPEEEHREVMVGNRKRKIRTIGDKWMAYEVENYGANTQPYYIMLGPNGEDLENGPADYDRHRDPEDFRKWLNQGLELYKKAK
jgi:thiol:disulfide interchange protein DsbD